MKRIKFYECPECGNVLTATGNAEVSCCGRKLSPLEARAADEEHTLQAETIEDEYYLAFSHPMTKEHYLSFAALVSYDRVLLVKLYPEQAAELRLPQLRQGTLYFYCHKHGLFKVKL